MNNVFSPNMLKTFEECPKKFYYQYVLSINLPQNKYLFEKGKNIHALANYYLKGEDVSKLEKVLNDEEKLLWQKLKQNKYFKMNVVNTEYAISSRIGEYWIGGRIDAVMKDGEKNYYILDYKTGTLPKNPENDFQTIVYLLCLDKLIIDKKSVKFVYLDLKNDAQIIIDFDEKIKLLYEEKIKNIIKKINFAKENENFSAIKNECSCEYERFCKNAIY